MSRQKTEQEVRDEFLNHVRETVEYWEKLEGQTTKGRLEGLAFSIMSTLDGCSCDVPPYIVAVTCDEELKQYYIEQGEDYYPEFCDISGCLHEEYFK